MKRSLSILMLTLTALTTFAPAAEAGRPRPIHRYRATYRQFDGGFYHSYGYRETCTTRYNGSWSSTTCYNIRPTEYVYIQEQITEDGHSRVQVYRNQDDKSPFVEYNVYHNVVEHRHYYDGWGYAHDDYYSRTYVSTEWAINWDSGWGKIVGGFEVGAIGTSVILNSASDDTGSKVVGGLLLGSGIASSISGAKQLHDEKTALEAEIAAQATAADADGTDVQ